MKYVLMGAAALLGIALLLLLAAVIRTLLTPRRESLWQAEKNPERETKYAELLSRMVRCETVSQAGKENREKFLAFHSLLAELFPSVHRMTEVNVIDGSLLFFWKGKSSEKPMVFMAHQDVVPAEGEWKHGHFSGDIAEGKVWGRGSADTKCSLMALLQAAEELLESGFVPENDLYLASSCNEETAGDGCPKIVEEFKRRGVKPYLVCDEGGAIVTSPLAGVKGNIAMVGILEKGQGNLLLSARSHGGHSSYPPKNSPIARLARFVCHMEKRSPLKAAFEPEVEAMFTVLAPYTPFLYRLLLGNMWLFKPILLKVLAGSPQAAALLKTTAAFTMQSGSDGLNVIPQEATLNVNLRYIPHQGMEASNRAIKKLAAKYDIEVTERECYDYCPPVSTQSGAYRLVEKVIGKVFPGLPVCPYVMTGGTDARHFQEICDACIRFSPVVYGSEQMKGMHGLNENIDSFSLPGAVDFYKELIKLNL